MFVTAHGNWFLYGEESNSMAWLWRKWLFRDFAHYWFCQQINEWKVADWTISRSSRQLRGPWAHLGPYLNPLIKKAAWVCIWCIYSTLLSHQLFHSVIPFYLLIKFQFYPATLDTINTGLYLSLLFQTYWQKSTGQVQEGGEAASLEPHPDSKHCLSQLLTLISLTGQTNHSTA